MKSLYASVAHARQRRNPARCGSSLVEVMVASAIGVALLGSIYVSMESANQAGRLLANRVAAFSRCRERFEIMRGGTSFAAVTEVNFPQETVRLTHLGGIASNPIDVTLTNRITVLGNPLRKEIEITATWEQSGRTHTETLSGIIVDRNAVANLVGAVSGFIALNPEGGPLGEFLVVMQDGTEYTKEDLEDPAFTGFSGDVARIEFLAEGSGSQTSLNYNFRSHPMANGKTWTVTGDALNATLSQSSGAWRLAIDGSGAVIASQ